VAVRFAENVEGFCWSEFVKVDIPASGHQACLLLYKQYLLVVTCSLLFSKIPELSLCYFILHFGDKTIAYILFSVFTSRPNSLLPTRVSVFIFCFLLLCLKQKSISYSIVNVGKAIVYMRTYQYPLED
jgi:hypothetical protein